MCIRKYRWIAASALLHEEMLMDCLLKEVIRAITVTFLFVCLH